MVVFPLKYCMKSRAPYVTRTLPTLLSRDMTPRYRLVTRWCGVKSEENRILNSSFLIFDQENKIFRNFLTQCMGKELDQFELCHTNHALALPPTCYDIHCNIVIRLPAKLYFYLPGCQLPSDSFTYYYFSSPRAYLKSRPPHCIYFITPITSGRSGGRIPRGGGSFRTRPDCCWSPPSLLYDGYRVILGAKATGAWR
jgi:hypothetical protein